MVFPLYDNNPFAFKSPPYVSWGLIAANVAIFLYMLSINASGSYSQTAVILALAFTPAGVGHHNAILPAFVPWELTLVSYAFLHASWLHVIGNMAFLWVFGDDVEEALGRRRFLVFYLLCGGIGALAFVASDPSFGGPLIGASGAISGVVVAYAMWRPCAKVTVLVSVIPLRISAYWVIGAFILTQLWNLESAGKSDVAYWCHFGGMLAGAVLFPLMRLPGVQLFECVRAPHYPIRPVDARLAGREPNG